MTGTFVGKRDLTRGLAWAAGALSFALLLSACGEVTDGRDAESGRSQTVARVNGEEITKHELEAELKNMGSAAPGQEMALARRALRRIVQRTLLAQQAMERKLDRSPDTMMNLRRARFEVLAKAYIDDTLARQMPISKFDVADFIERNPHHFTARKHYVFDQLLVTNGQVTDRVMDAIKDLKTLEDVETALSRLKVDYSRRLNANLGSQFPKDLVKRIDALSTDEIFFIRTRENAVISRIVSSRPQPVTGENAEELAERMLLAQRDASASRKAIDDLAITSRIQFLGDFADMRIFETATSAMPVDSEKSADMADTADASGTATDEAAQ